LAVEAAEEGAGVAQDEAKSDRVDAIAGRAKDEDDDLNVEIEKNFRNGYVQHNIFSKALPFRAPWPLLK
jgi:hypothetical protein